MHKFQRCTALSHPSHRTKKHFTSSYVRISRQPNPENTNFIIALH